MNRLQQLRETAGFSRADLARRSDVTQSVIEQLENGAHPAQAERAVLVPGETPVEDIAVILNKLADALGASLIAQGISVTPEELLEPAPDEVPPTAEAASSDQPSDETLPALPLVGVSYPSPEADLPPDARSHHETETPDDIDAALGQMALNSQITAAEEAAETGADEYSFEPTGPAAPVSPATDTEPDSAPDFTEPLSAGLVPTGGTETINMAELPDTLPIGVLPDSPPVVQTEEISPLTGQPENQAVSETDQDFASQETQEIYIPPEVRASLPTYNTPLATDAQPVPTTQLPVESPVLPPESPPVRVNEVIDRMLGRTGQVEVAPVGVADSPATGESAFAPNDAPTLEFDLSAVRAQPVEEPDELPVEQPVRDITELERAEMPVEAAALEVADEPSSVVMAEEAAAEAAEPQAPDEYEAVPVPDMPGPAPAPETMLADSEAHPEPPDLAGVAKEHAITGMEATDAATDGVPAHEAQPVYPPPANLGLETAHALDSVAHNSSVTPVPPVAPTSLELQAAVPAQDDAPLTTTAREKPPVMQPYLEPAPAVADALPPPSPESLAAANRYKLPPSTVIPSVVGVVAALGWYAWRSWRRSRTEAERVAPYFKKK